MTHSRHKYPHIYMMRNDNASVMFHQPFKPNTISFSRIHCNHILAVFVCSAVCNNFRNNYDNKYFRRLRILKIPNKMWFIFVNVFFFVCSHASRTWAICKGIIIHGGGEWIEFQAFLLLGNKLFRIKSRCSSNMDCFTARCDQEYFFL